MHSLSEKLISSYYILADIRLECDRFRYNGSTNIIIIIIIILVCEHNICALYSHPTSHDHQMETLYNNKTMGQQHSVGSVTLICLFRFYLI